MTGLRRSGRHVVMASTGTGAEMTQSCGVSQDPGLTKPGLVGKYDELGAAAWLVSCEHLADVNSWRRLREMQPVGELAIAEAVGDQADHVA